MIRSFKDKSTHDIFHQINSRHARQLLARDLWRMAIRKIDMIDAAKSPDDLRALKGNRLEALHGRLKGYYSIRINDQWRVIFKWKEGAAEEVQIIDYH